MATTVLTDDLVVEILSRLPLKSFCRFKCVCKSWLAFSSHPYYRQKLPRTPTGLLYWKHEGNAAIHLARLLSSDRDIHMTHNFGPYYEYSELIDCSNGLLLCHCSVLDSYIHHAIVFNPATEEWVALPHTQSGPDVYDNILMLCFDPLWSQHFYVFNFELISFPEGGHNIEIKVFYSENSTWSSLGETKDMFCGGSLFVNGVLYVEHLWGHYLLALDAPDTCTHLLNHRTLQLPGFPNGPERRFYYSDGCLCQSSGVLCYAQQELDGCMIRIWSLEGSDKWVVKHRLNMDNVFGRDLMFRTTNDGFWYFDYEILAFDLERELVILADTIADNKVISYSISTGKSLQILDIPRFVDLYCHRSLLYVPYYGKCPGYALRGAQDGC